MPKSIAMPQAMPRHMALTIAMPQAMPRHMALTIAQTMADRVAMPRVVLSADAKEKGMT